MSPVPVSMFQHKTAQIPAQGSALRADLSSAFFRHTFSEIPVLPMSAVHHPHTALTVPFSYSFQPAYMPLFSSCPSVYSVLLRSALLQVLRPQLCRITDSTAQLRLRIHLSLHPDSFPSDTAPAPQNQVSRSIAPVEAPAVPATLPQNQSIQAARFFSAADSSALYPGAKSAFDAHANIQVPLIAVRQSKKIPSLKSHTQKAPADIALSHKS